MARLKIENPNWGDGSNATSSMGTVVSVDGQKLSAVFDLTLRLGVNEPVRAEIHVFANPEELDLPADVLVVCHKREPEDETC